MNAANRKQVKEFQTEIHALKAKLEALLNVDAIEEFKGDVDNLAEQVGQLTTDEEEKFENLSDGLKQSEKGQAIETAANALSEVFEQLEGIAGELDSAMGSMNNAINALDEANNALDEVRADLKRELKRQAEANNKLDETES
jgi:chromosome segregation ATPase